MDIGQIQTQSLHWVAVNGLKLAVTATVVLIYVLVDRFTAPRLEESAEQGRFRSEAGDTAVNVARLIGAVIALAALVFVWGIDVGALLIFTTTTITLLGVALFATWSILSNVTAYFILMLQPTFRRGNFVRIIDLDNYIEGYISELRLFNTRLVTERREVIIYPNNLMLGRVVILNPRDRRDGIGKITDLGDTAYLTSHAMEPATRLQPGEGE